MTQNSPSTQLQDRLKWLRNLLLFLLFFLYVWLKINPRLYFQQQEPAFFTTASFWREFLSYPGGLTDYLAAFLTQLYYFPWLGALLITLIAWLAVWAFNRMIQLAADMLKKALPDSINLLPLFLLVLLISVHNNYEHTLNLTLGYVLALLVALVYQKFSSQNSTYRILVFLGLSVVLYYLAGGSLLLFAILCLIFEIFVRGNFLVSAVIVIGSLLIPYLSSALIFMINLSQAFLYLLPFKQVYQPAILPYVWYLYPPIVLLLLVLRLRMIHAEDILIYQLPLVGKFLQKHYRGINRLVTDAVILIGLGYLIAQLTFNATFKYFLSLDYYAENHNWEQVIKVARKQDSVNELTTCLANRALAQRGQLLNDLFSYPQYYGVDGLFMSRDIRNAFPIIRSDIMFDLGHLNEAEHWAQEAISLKGMRPRNLKRLALINLLKGQRNSCLKCLDILHESPLFRKWSNHYYAYLNNDTLLANDRELAEIKARMAKADFIANISSPELDLENLLKQHPDNRLVFEYLGASYLLGGELVKFIEYFPRYFKTNYYGLPRHYTEAMLVYMTESKKGSLPLLGNMTSMQSTVKRFKDFKRILSDYKGSKYYAQHQLQQNFGDTYWYYVLYLMRSANEQ
jgi:hypothetical protein